MRNIRSAVAETFEPGEVKCENAIMTHDVKVPGSIHYRFVYYVNQMSGEYFILGHFQIFKYTKAFTPNKLAPLNVVHTGAVIQLRNMLEPTGWTIHNNEWKTI